MSPYPITGDVNFDDLARVGLSGFSSAKLLFYFTLSNNLWAGTLSQYKHAILIKVYFFCHPLVIPSLFI